MIDINALWYYTVIALNDKNIPNSLIKSFKLWSEQIADDELWIKGKWKYGKNESMFVFRYLSHDEQPLEKALADRIAFQIERQIFPKKHDIAEWLEQEMDRRQG